VHASLIFNQQSPEMLAPQVQSYHLPSASAPLSHGNEYVTTTALADVMHSFQRSTLPLPSPEPFSGNQLRYIEFKGSFKAKTVDKVQMLLLINCSDVMQVNS